MSETSTPLSSRSTPADLKTLHGAVAEELVTFKKFFKSALKTDVFLLNQLLTYLHRMKGKEIRPTLVFLSAKTAGNVSDRTNVAATMIELLHTATLIHDDVVDEADKRRGLHSINKIWKNKAGVLLGDFLLSKGLLIALDHDEYELLKILSHAVRRMSEGELRQFKASSLQNMTREKYFQVISDKTASLISACCEAGAVSAGANTEEQLKMREIGELIGIAFQIRDDILDYGSHDIGKPTGNDIQERKVTLPLIEALAQADATEARRIRRLFARRKKSTADVDDILRFVRNSGGLDRTREVMEEYGNRALKLLSEFPESDARESMKNTVLYIVQRKK